MALMPFIWAVRCLGCGFANNFSIEEIAEAAAYAHGLGKKVYVTVNIFAHNEDLARLPD